MKNNQNANRNRQSANGSSRKVTLNRTRPQMSNQTRSTNATRPLSSVKSRIGGQPGKSNLKPIVDLRQVLAKKTKSPTTATTPTSNVKSRLGLQSQTARLEAKKEAKAQLKAAQEKKTPIKGIKTANSQLNKNTVLSTVTPAKNKSDARVQSTSKLTTRKQSSTQQPIGFRAARSITDPNLSTRRPLERSQYKADYRNRSSAVIKSVATQPIIIPQYIPATSQPAIFYQSPSNHLTNYESHTPSRYANRNEVNISSDSTSSTVGNSVLVSNLSSKITEDDVAELFGDIGPLMDLQIINSTTALVTYFASQHAVKAVKVYNFRLLDGVAMNCTILPKPTGVTASQPSSNQQPLHSSRMYSDYIPASRSGILRSNYHLGL